MKNIYLKIIYAILAKYAKKVLKKHNPIIIAVTGSVGKTSTKEAIYHVLADAFKGEVRRNYGNLNAEIGVPLTILGYQELPNKYLWPVFLLLAWFRTSPKSYPKYLVLEMGIEQKGDIAYLTGIAQPDYVVLTSTTPAHILYFDDVKSYQDEKISIIKALKPQGKAIVNYDDEVLKKLNDDNIVSFAVDNGADYRATDIKTGLSGTDFRVVCTGYKVAVKSLLLGKHMIYSQLAAFAVADLLGVSRLQVGKSLQKIKPVPGRMSLIDGKNNMTIIDDTYNSNPTSAKAAIELLSSLPHKDRKVLILGNMNELGSEEKKAHEDVGNFAKDRCDLAIFVGPNAGSLARGFDDNKRSMIFKNRSALLLDIDMILKENDLVLIKASQNNNFFEEITKHLMKNPKLSDALLVRQGKFWRNKK